MAAIPPTQLPIEHGGQQYSGVYSVSGNLMIARIPGLGSKSIELDDTSDPTSAAAELLSAILAIAKREGRL